MELRSSEPAASRGRWRGRVGVAFVCGVVLGACSYDGRDEFIDRATYLVQEIQAKCADGGNIVDPRPPEEVQSDLQECSTRCEYNRRKARRCIKRLESKLKNCRATSILSCRGVFHRCDESEDGESTCENIDRSDLGDCSVDPDREPSDALWGLVLVALGIRSRRR